MPTQHAHTLRAPSDSTSIAPTHPYPLTPPAESGLEGEEREPEPPCPEPREEISNIAVDDNTAAGMSLMQDESMYGGHETMTDANTPDAQAFAEKEKIMIQDLYTAADTQANEGQVGEDQVAGDGSSPTPSTSASARDGAHQLAQDSVQRQGLQASNDSLVEVNSPREDRRATPSTEPDALPPRLSASPKKATTFPKVSMTSESSDVDYGTKPWDFTYVPLSSEYPSSLLHPGSKFEGTQQSDRQIYHVTVTVHTVDIPQATISGYLKIEGLTPDHPTLTTFFTGEIIGGPDQKYSFQTKHEGWGATDKTDLIHWARFPAWRPLSRDAKRDINFQYPMPGTGLLGNDGWWQQEHIFMRWKEWFLVPDHRVRSIQGASFEGFYYICFNQVEGRISGIYFHARSEKYQQLELKHEGETGVWNKGVRPAMEFR